MNIATLFFLIFLAEGSAEFTGFGYHFRDENSPSRIHSNLTQCEYLYDDAYKFKHFLMVFPSEKEIVKKKIGFYCEGEYSECCGVSCCIPKAVIIERSNKQAWLHVRPTLLFFSALVLMLLFVYLDKYFKKRENREKASQFLQRIRERITGIFSRNSRGDAVSTTGTDTTTID